jgi:hypothetical protein
MYAFFGVIPMIKQLILKHGISRTQETYGYNRVTLQDTTTGKKYACVGGGYDMVGTVFAEWLQDNCQVELVAIAHKAYYTYDQKCLSYNEDPCRIKLYGMTAYTHKEFVMLDGACGLESMLTIAKHAGISVQRQVDNKGRLIGFFA